MMMKRYYSAKVHLRPQLRYDALLGGEELPVALARCLEGVVVSRWEKSTEGGDLLTLDFSGSVRDDLRAEIERAAVQVGYSLVEAEVEEFVDKAATGLVAGFVGIGGVAGLKTRNLLVTLLAGAAGAFAGEKAGAAARILVAHHRYQLHRSRRWIVTKLPVTPTGQSEVPQADPMAAFVLPD
jgi:hypothetical protein